MDNFVGEHHTEVLHEQSDRIHAKRKKTRAKKRTDTNARLQDSIGISLVSGPEMEVQQVPKHAVSSTHSKKTKTCNKKRTDARVVQESAHAIDGIVLV